MRKGSVVFACVLGGSLALGVQVAIVYHFAARTPLLEHNLSAPEASSVCKHAMEEEGFARASELSTGDGVIGSFSTAEVTYAEHSANGYTVDGVLRFQLSTVFNTTPVSVPVACSVAGTGKEQVVHVYNR